MTYYIVIIPGFNEAQLTDNFLKSLARREKVWVFPDLPLLKAQDSLILIAFSAGVLGAIALVWGWQLQGICIKALIALDGWGVPLGGNLPIHRCSHDYFTHWSSALLGTGQDNFYAEPGVEHLQLWGSQKPIPGWRVTQGERCFMTLTNYLADLLNQYD
jgi:hypothetical protein